MQNTPYPKNATFGKRLKVARALCDMTQEQLRDEMLKQCGVAIGQSYLSELERSSKAPSLAVAAAIAQVLNISLDYLGLLTNEPAPVRAYRHERISVADLPISLVSQ